MVIAIDGPAGAGKSTVARHLARRLGFTYLDSGAMYRCVALKAIEEGVPLNDGERLGELAANLEIAFGPEREGSTATDREDRPSTARDGNVATDREDRPAVGLDGRDVSDAIRAPAVTAAASEVSVHAPVRAAMVAQQQRLIATGRYVAEGRDIGTVVSPDSPLKVFLTASDEERARRRAAETGETEAEVLAAQDERDSRDRGREHGALRPAEDAIEVDTTGLPIDVVVERIAVMAEERGIV